MIEFTLPMSSILANLLCLMMLMCFAGIGWGIAALVTKKGKGYEIDMLLSCIILLFIFDLAAMGGSYNYATTPIEGYYNCIDGYRNDEVACHYHPESENPFANQPIHPIFWTTSTITNGLHFMNDAIKIKVT